MTASESQDLRPLLGVSKCKLYIPKRNRLGALHTASDRCVISIRSPLANMCRRGKKNLMLRIVEEIAKGFILLCGLKLPKRVEIRERNVGESAGRT